MIVSLESERGADLSGRSFGGFFTEIGRDAARSGDVRRNAMKRILGLALAMAVALGVAAPAWAATAESINCTAYSCKPACPGTNCVRALLGKNVQIGKGKVYTWQGFPGPCANPSNSLLLIEKQAPDEVMLGDEVMYQIQVSNRSNDLLRGSVVTEILPEGIEFVRAEPEAAVTGKTLSWSLGDMPAKTAKVLCVYVRTTQLGCQLIKASAQVCVEISVPIAMNVVDCSVELEKWMPDRVDGCDPFPVKICVKNPGTAAATNICVTDVLPENMTEVRTGKRELSWNIDSLAPGAVKEIVFNVCASKPGDYTNLVTATADRCNGISAMASTKVIAPNLQIFKSGPAKTYLGMPAVYEVTIVNNGDSVARDVKVVDSWSGSKAKFVTTSEKVAPAKGSNAFTWNIGDLGCGESRTLKVELCALETGTLANTACATLTCRCQPEPRIAAVQTEVIGVAGVTSFVTKDKDAIPLDCEVTFSVRVENQGNKAATNIRITGSLDEGMEYVSAKGPTEVKVDGKSLTFGALPKLAGKDGATWYVTVKATSEGDKRLDTKLLTDHMDQSRPVINEESVTFYAPGMVTASSN
jgi:uncharacterized repeat protein (TIGR01451 family)